ncbi:aldo/keto reductase family protein [Nonomuraea turcica]|uniref:aldo/keto reductase family protein n=1 Tax=Nonomuraea sp. G32 TaxID=3067274 RepID=UPI00273CDF59|nr:aldo/keto reductase family protein [Nonomuraea sp. G32]MDP4500918.1 aldo/keto reductase family protein [Nonomuraea sp. G32]
MKFRHLGHSGLMVSEIAYGNWLTEDTVEPCVHAALDAGITTFDTADAYAETRAEEALGQALRGIRRDSVEILTKIYWPTGPGPNDRGLSRKHIMRSIDGSLRRLGTDYVDLYQAHRYDYATPLEETLRAFDDLVRAGKVLYVGVSDWTAEQIADALRIADDLGLDRIVSNQPQYNMLRRVIEPEILPLCAKEGVGQLVYQPMAQGVLAGRYSPGQAPPAEARREFVDRLLTDDVLTRVERLRPIAADLGLSMAQLAIAWVLRGPGVSAAIVGGSRPEQVHDSAAASGVPLGDDVLSAIDEILDDVVERMADGPFSPLTRP